MRASPTYNRVRYEHLSVDSVHSSYASAGLHVNLEDGGWQPMAELDDMVADLGTARR